MACLHSCSYSHRNWLAISWARKPLIVGLCVCASVRSVWSAWENVVKTHIKRKRSSTASQKIVHLFNKLVRKLTYVLTNVRVSAAVCKLILTNVHKLVRKLTNSLTNVCTSAAIFILIRTGLPGGWARKPLIVSLSVCLRGAERFWERGKTHIKRKLGSTVSQKIVDLFKNSWES